MSEITSNKNSIKGNGSNTQVAFFNDNRTLTSTGSFVISGTGNVGIGTSGPLAKLSVGGSGLAGETAHFEDNAVDVVLKSNIGTNYVLQELQNAGGTAFVGIENSIPNALTNNAVFPYAMVIRAPNTRPLTFATQGDTRMLIGSTGRVGIATQTPSEFLEVAGNINASGTGKFMCGAATGFTGSYAGSGT